MRDTVAGIETHRRELTFGETLLLPQILGLRNVEIAALFETDELIEIAPGFVLHGYEIRRLLRGPGPREKRGWSLKPVRKPSLRLVTKRLADTNATELKIAKKLGVEPSDIAVASQKLWGCSLSRKRDIRASHEGSGLEPRSLQAKKAIITRQLIEELEKELKANVKGERKE